MLPMILAVGKSTLCSAQSLQPAGFLEVMQGMKVFDLGVCVTCKYWYLVLCLYTHMYYLFCLLTLLHLFLLYSVLWLHICIALSD